jgi:CDP-2,3-bis-(O-geranylgeranyl)-sn-glycerol synthase
MHDFMARLGALLYFMLPAYVGNMAPPLLRFWHGWNRPLHERLLGAHKTVLGVLVGVAAALVTTAVQAHLPWPWPLLDYTHWPWLGLAFGVGALGGDAFKSLLKRRLGRAPGRPWVPFDQLDFVLGALLLVGWQARLHWTDVVVIVVFSFLADLLVNRIAYRLGIKSTPW